MNQKLVRALKDPQQAWFAIRVRVKGLLFRRYCKLFRPRVTIGRNFKLGGRLSIRGPGRVIIGDNVECGGTVAPWTYHRDAVIRIGDRVFLNATRFGCQKEIRIGDGCILADCRLMDTDFHSVYPEHRHDPNWIRSAPIKVEENVWLAANCFVLKGVTIGKGSTITPNSVVATRIPPGSVAAGNPAKVIWHHEDASASS